MADVTARMLALLSTLQTGRAFGGEELAQRLAVSPRTLRRDVDRLRGYGYPVETQPGPGGYYQLTAGRTMPPLVLDDDEAVATLLALATLAASGPNTAHETGGIDEAATRAYGKLDQFMPARLRGQVRAVRASLESSSLPAPTLPADRLSAIAGAIAQQETISFTYRTEQGSEARRRVEPYRQIQFMQRWYLLGWDLERDDWRVFRLDRVSDLVSTGSRYQERPLPADSAVDYLRQGLDRDKQTVQLLVEAPVEQVTDALKYQNAEIEAVTEQRTEVRLAVDSWQWLVLSLALLDADFQVVDGAGFATACQVFAHRLLTATG